MAWKHEKPDPLERRANRLLAQGRAIPKPPEDDTPGFTDAEFDTFKRDKAKKSAEEKEAREIERSTHRLTIRERADRIERDELPVNPMELASVYERAVKMVDSDPADSRDKTSLRDAMKMLFDAAKTHKGKQQEDPLRENYDYWVDGVEKAYAAEKSGADPEKMREMAVWDAEHAGRVLQREALTLEGG